MIGQLPSAPNWTVDWDESLEWVIAMKNCPQKRIYHGEGDVWIHTKMVVEALLTDPAFRQLPEDDRSILFHVALLHDVGKPECTRMGPDGPGSPGHARRGSILARKLLWEKNFDPRLREQICSLILYHMVPFWMIDEQDWERQLLAITLRCRADFLAIQARADARGRICQDPERLLQQVDLFEQLAFDHGVLNCPPTFANDHSRVLYFLRGGDPKYARFELPKYQVTMLSGLPAAGKDYWLENHGQGLPSISLDRLRQELNVSPTDSQSRVVDAAREQAKIFLRKGQEFIWNATNLSREQRSRHLGLFTDYQASVRIVYLEAPAEELERRNNLRELPVPGQAIERMLRNWEPPDLTEAHQIVIPGLQTTVSPPTKES
jgi:predicted kinase